jgi:hypothetical protein
MRQGYACFACGEFISTQFVGRQDVCQCVFFDQSVYNQCSEPMADRVVDKTKANFCDYFKVAVQTEDLKKERKMQPSDLARQNAESLFRKKAD